MESLPSLLAKFKEQEMKIINFLAANDPENVDNYAEKFFEVKEDLNNKINSWCWAMSFMQNEIDYCKQQEQRFEKMRKIAENKKSRMKSYLQQVVEDQGGKVKCPDFKLSLRSCAPKLVLLEEDLKSIPEKYITVKPEINCQLVKEDLKKGVEIPFACLQTKYALYIS